MTGSAFAHRGAPGGEESYGQRIALARGGLGRVFLLLHLSIVLVFLVFLDDLVLAGDIVRESGEAAGQPDIAIGRGKKGAMPGRRGLGLALLIAGIAGFLLILGGLGAFEVHRHFSWLVVGGRGWIATQNGPIVGNDGLDIGKFLALFLRDVPELAIGIAPVGE